MSTAFVLNILKKIDILSKLVKDVFKVAKLR